MEKKLKKKYIYFRPLIKSRHPSHSDLRSRNGQILPLLPFKSIIRFGSQKELQSDVTNGGDRIELNTVQSIKNSSNKLLMKSCFTNNNVKTADWWRYYSNTIFHNTNQPFDENFDANAGTKIEDLPYPIISKHIYGSRGTGNKKHDTLESLQAWMQGKNINNYIFEKFYNYNREYRLHVTENGCFYTCRKMLKQDTDENHRWYRNNDNSVWILEDNTLFDKPVNWDSIIEESVKALKAVGLDFGAVDLRVQSTLSKKEEARSNPDFIIIEINSAPSFGDITKIKYIEEIPKLLKKKWEILKKNQ